MVEAWWRLCNNDVRNFCIFMKFYIRRVSIRSGTREAGAVKVQGDTSMFRSMALALSLILGCLVTASAEECGDKLQQDKSQQNSADEAQVRGDLKAGSECATQRDKDESAKKNEDRAAKLKSQGKVKDQTTPDHTSDQAHPK